MTHPDPALLDEVVKRIVAAVDPRRIILFGSAARGEMRPDSDLDLLVVMPDGVHRRQTAQVAYHSLRGLGVSKDVIVVTEHDVDKYRDEFSYVIAPALEEGKELYNVTH
ncbi:MAG: nucleotidyltransferase domain-containing protein [Magnetococcales bacterium]|nr:nucleotidyltransferase domain-containing protein [Magnetococcales bacterium]